MNPSPWVLLDQYLRKRRKDTAYPGLKVLKSAVLLVQNQPFELFRRNVTDLFLKESRALLCSSLGYHVIIFPSFSYTVRHVLLIFAVKLQNNAVNVHSRLFTPQKCDIFSAWNVVRLVIERLINSLLFQFVLTHAHWALMHKNSCCGIFQISSSSCVSCCFCVRMYAVSQ